VTVRSDPCAFDPCEKMTGPPVSRGATPSVAPRRKDADANAGTERLQRQESAKAHLHPPIDTDAIPFPPIPVPISLAVRYTSTSDEHDLADLSRPRRAYSRTKCALPPCAFSSGWRSAAFISFHLVLQRQLSFVHKPQVRRYIVVLSVEPKRGRIAAEAVKAVLRAAS